MLLSAFHVTEIGSDDPVVRWFLYGADSGPKTGIRALLIDGTPAFEMSYACGTCYFLFRRLEGADHTLSLESMQHRLNTGLDSIDREVVDRFADLLPKGDYLVTLSEVAPRLVAPGGEDDYFTHELVASWGEQYGYDPRSLNDSYYRTFETPVVPPADDKYQVYGHLYEFVVPMVPPAANDPIRVADYRDALNVLQGSAQSTGRPTAVAVSMLDVTVPVRGPDENFYIHWGLIHFLLDGHHKMQAAAETGQTVNLLSLVAINQGLSSIDEVMSLPDLLAQPSQRRDGVRGR